MNDIPMTRKQFVDHLIKENKFRLIAPSTLLYEDERDVIIVSIRPGIVIITGDGNGVVPNWNIIQIRDNPDCFFWDGVLQDVLAKF